jgi:molybdopterin-guanine dinucleotide biosynthesis protein A
LREGEADTRVEVARKHAQRSDVTAVDVVLTAGGRSRRKGELKVSAAIGNTPTRPLVDLVPDRAVDLGSGEVVGNRHDLRPSPVCLDAAFHRFVSPDSPR